MIFCTKCGKQFDEIAGFCPACGTPAYKQATVQPKQPDVQQFEEQQQPQVQQTQYQQPQVQQTQVKQQENAELSGLTKAAKALMIVGAILTSISLYFIPAIWCLPMAVVYFKKLKKGKPISTAFKVCTIIFVSPVAGILMLCDKEH